MHSVYSVSQFGPFINMWVSICMCAMVLMYQSAFRESASIPFYSSSWLQSLGGGQPWHEFS